MYNHLSTSNRNNRNRFRYSRTIIHNSLCNKFLYSSKYLFSNRHRNSSRRNRSLKLRITCKNRSPSW